MDPEATINLLEPRASYRTGDLSPAGRPTGPYRSRRISMPIYSIPLTRYNYDTKQVEQVTASGEVPTHTVANGLRDPHIMASLLEDCVNYGGPGSRGSGARVGRALHNSHRALQDFIVWWAIGLLRGIAEQTTWDQRNAFSLAIAKHISRLHDDDWSDVPKPKDYA